MPIIDISDDVVSDLGPSLVADAVSTGPDSLRWDCSIGGMNFLFAMSDQFPFKRETASFRRDRVDTQRNPGEQSLDSGFWLRSQASWHYGSGLSSAEPLEVSEEEALFRYQQGGGIDPWTAGEVSLLHDTTKVHDSTGTGQLLIGVDTGVLHADATTLTYVSNSASTGASVSWGGSASPIASMTSDGANYYVANAVGVYKGALPNGSGSLIWNTGSAPMIRWVKGRLFGSVGVSLYELTSGGPTLPTAHYTHPNSNWVWSDFAEGPTAIYAAGYAGDTSSIYRLTVGTTTSTVTLDQPAVVADMPRGELVYSLYSYVGSYLIVGTNKGSRVAIINSDGSLSLGPLVVTSADGCKDAVADGSYVYVTVGGKGEAGDRVQRAGLFRIDLSSNLNRNELQFPSAADLVCTAGLTGAADQVTTAGGKVWFTVTGTGGGVFKESADYVAEGWLETGRIRMGTVESKAWRSLRLLQKEGTTGTLTGFGSVSGTGNPSSWTQIIQTATSTYDVAGSLIVAAPAPLASMHIAVRLTRASASTTPVFVGWQVKAVPSPSRSELVSVPVLLFDWESDRHNVRYGGEGSAWTRYAALKEIEEARSTVTWLDYTTGERAEAFVEQVALTRTTPPSKAFRGAGGVMTVLLRLL